MEVVIQPTAEAATMVAGTFVAGLYPPNPHAVVALPSGLCVTPLRLYWEAGGVEDLLAADQDVQLGRRRGRWPGSIRSLYPASCGKIYSTESTLPNRTCISPTGWRRTFRDSAKKYEKQIRTAGGIDLQLLGIGTDGHIGFNEPSSSLASRTRINMLTRQTRRDNARFFGSEERVPHHAITMGIGTILEARHCVLLAFGKRKAARLLKPSKGR